MVQTVAVRGHAGSKRDREPSREDTVSCSALLDGGLEAEWDELRDEAAPVNRFGIPPVLLTEPRDEQ